MCGTFEDTFIDIFSSAVIQVSKNSIRHVFTDDEDDKGNN